MHVWGGARGGHASCSGRTECSAGLQARCRVPKYPVSSQPQARHPAATPWQPSAATLHGRRRRQLMGISMAAAVDKDKDLEGMMKGELSDDMLQRIDDWTKVIGEMIMEVSKDVFVADPSGEALSEEDMAAAEVEAARRAVQSRMRDLDEAFLLTLGGFVQSAAQEGDEAMHARLSLLHREVLSAVRAQLPPEVQLLDTLLAMQDSEARVEVLRTRLEGAAPHGDLGAAAGDSSDGPAVDPQRLDTAASQFIEDMEDKAEVPDRRLLARVCLVREEVQNVAREASYSSGRPGAGFQPTADQAARLRGGVPRRAVAFLQAVMKVPTREGRMAYLRKAFLSDWEGAAPERAGSGTDDDRATAVRPGRFLTALGTTQAEVTRDGAGVGEGVLERLEDVRRETIEVLMEMSAAAPA